MNEQALIGVLNHEMDIALPEDSPFAAIRLRVQAVVSHLIATDFQQLVHVLYRVDVNERKLKYLLQENVGEDTAVIIADLIIERQLEKIITREKFGSSPGEADTDEERW